MVLTKVSGDWISMMSEMGATSSLAATLGSRFYQTGRRGDPQIKSAASNVSDVGETI